jgi:hypothetical protein
MKTMSLFSMLLALFGLAAANLSQANEWTVYDGKAGPGNGKHIVFMSGDEEYRSEEALPMRSTSPGSL